MKPHPTACDGSLAQALQPKTDSEAWGPLIYRIDWRYFAGCIAAPILFCPWCGAQLGVETTCGEAQ